MKHHLSISIAVAATLLCACTDKGRRTADIDGIDLNVKIERFDSAFWNIDTADIPTGMKRVAATYPGITDVYLQNVVNFGHSDSALTHYTYRLFRRDTAVTQLYSDCLSAYSDLSGINDTLTDAFRRARYFFPHIPTPRLYAHVSGLNQSIVIGEGFMSISLDNYLGTHYPLYSLIGIYEYQRNNMTRAKIAPDYIIAWLSSEYYQRPHSTLLDDILYHGKILYAAASLLPTTPEQTIMGYTPDQWQWMQQHEHELWQLMLANRALYETNILVKNQYLSDGPFTLPFSQASPARGGAYMGWQIIKSFMKANPSISLQQLMELPDAQNILSRSAYRP